MEDTPAAGLDAVIFDLGNTLIYFDGDWPAVFMVANQELLKSLLSAGLELDETLFLAEFKSRMEAYYSERDTEFIEHTTAYLLNQLLVEFGQPPLAEYELRAALRAMYAVPQARWRIEADAHFILNALVQQGYQLGLISNASDDEDVQTLVDQNELRPYFKTIITSASAGIRKPNPRLFLDAGARMGVDPSRTAVVGDRLGADILGAHNAGMLGILITRRADTAANRAHQETIRPDAVIATLEELPSVLQTLGAGYENVLSDLEQ